MKRQVTTLLSAVVVLAILFSVAGLATAGPLARPHLQGGAPTVVSYQGQVTVDGIAYTGTGYFKFAIVNAAGNTTYWSNDGTSVGGGQPTKAVQLAVSSGLFNVLLGDTSLANMTALPASTFSGTDRYLRVWFSSDGTSFTQLSPDRRIASVPYALQAEEAKNAATAGNADLLDGQHGSAYQARVSGTCGVGSTIRAVNADGTVVCQVDAPLNRPLAPQNNALAALDSAGDVGYFTSITIGADGLGLISYWDDINDDLKVAHCRDALCSSATTYTLDSAGNVGWDTSITIGADGLGLISYCDYTNGDLKAAHCSDALCSSASLATLASAGWVGYHTSITIGADGLGLISYRDNPNHALKAAHCSDALCSSATTYTLDSAGYVGQFTSITIGADGLGLISYYDYTNTNSSALKVAHCSDALCSSATTYTLDSAGSVGLYTSITIGADGLGLISYWDATNGDLKAAHCSDALCSSAAAYTLDSAGEVGRYTSITIGADGLGLISYQDYTNFDLKVAHCSNTFCTPYFRRR